VGIPDHRPNGRLHYAAEASMGLWCVGRRSPIRRFLERVLAPLVRTRSTFRAGVRREARAAQIDRLLDAVGNRSGVFDALLIDQSHTVRASGLVNGGGIGVKDCDPP
jgi:hypothetical protein